MIEIITSNKFDRLNSILNTWVLVLLLLILYSCATIISPSGGPKDTASPIALNSEPENYSTSFNSKLVKITFNEYIQLKNLHEQLIVSPPLEQKPDFRIKGKTLIIEFDDSLAANTTYSINFGNAVCDITENNPIENFRYVFSTGDYLDSLFVNGKVEDAFDLKTEKGVLVMLYKCGDTKSDCDSLPYKSLPDYFTKTDNSGSFTINNIKDGDYKIFALKDENRNYLYDLPNEKIAFRGDNLNPADSLNITLSLFKEEKSVQYLAKAFTAKYGKLTFIFNEPTNNVKLQPLNYRSKKPWEIKDYSKNKDTLYYWTTMSMDTLELAVYDYENYDATQPVFSDTVKIALIKQKEGLQLKLKTNINPKKNFDIYKDISLEFSHPVSSYDFSKVIITEGSDSTRADTINYKMVFEDKAMRKFKINYPWKEDSTYRILIPKGCFSDIFNLQNERFWKLFKIQSSAFYGSVKLNLKLPGKDHQPIIQLLDNKETVVKEKFHMSTQVIEFSYLNSGNYKIKIIWDANDNLLWDTGNYLEGRQPEKVQYYPGTTTVRSNWDIELEWKEE